MNEPRSSKYQRARRRAAAATILATGTLLAALLLTGWSIRLRDVSHGSVVAYVGLLAAINGLVTLPFVWYRSYHLEKLYALSQITRLVWCRDYLRTAAVSLAATIVAAECISLAMRISWGWWWLSAALGIGALLAVLTALGPVLVLPIFHRTRPLAHDPLKQRLLELSARAGVRVLNVHEWPVGAGTHRANAALVGAGTTRRILLSDTLLDQYTEDEIEVVLAHEIGHHVHRDIVKGLAAELALLVVALYAASAALTALWQPLGLRSVSDIAGLPLIALTTGAVSLAAAPLLNAWSRMNERRADRFAIELTSRPDAFIATIRRMAAQNLAEERPTAAARWFFNTHPGVEERIRGALLQRKDGVWKAPRDAT